MPFRVAVVTGANKGIGFGVVKNLARNFNGHVFLTARDSKRGVAATKRIWDEEQREVGKERLVDESAWL